jgi:ABC-2 type transport system permease protein
MRFRPYLALMKATFKENMAYRLEFFSMLFEIAIGIVLLYSLWFAIFAASGSAIIQGFTFPMMLTYISIVAVLRVVNNPGTEGKVEGDVKMGNIATKLTKPISYPLWRFSTETGYEISTALLTGIIGFAVAKILFNISLPASPLFFVSVVLGLIINFLLSFIVAMWAFWTTGYIWGMRVVREVTTDILSGAIVPLAFFPAFMKSIAIVLPFQAVINLPMSIYLGTISGWAIMGALMIQLSWVALLIILTFIIWRRSLKRIVVQGG